MVKYKLRTCKLNRTALSPHPDLRSDDAFAGLGAEAALSPARSTALSHVQMLRVIARPVFALSHVISTPKFPANREKNREFCKIRTLGAILKAYSQANSAAYSEIPYATETGNYLRGCREFGLHLRG
jgi:hypothetical protein